MPIQIATGDGTGGLQTLTMTNVSSNNATNAGAPTVLQYAQSADGQIFIPGNIGNACRRFLCLLFLLLHDFIESDVLLFNVSCDLISHENIIYE